MIIPDLNIEFHRYDDSKWTVETSEGYFLINQSTKELIEILMNSSSMKEASEKFNHRFHENINETDFESWVENVLKDFPILEKQITEKLPQKSYIKFQQTLLNAKWVNYLSKPFEPLFQPNFFWSSYGLLVVFSIYLLYVTFQMNLTISFIWMSLLYLPTILLHELGHTAACKRFTNKVGEIGFGIYFLFPVFYSDVSSIWKTTKEQRIITNLAGVYMQMWCSLLFWILSKVFDQSMFLQMAFLLAIYSFFQLIPFIRSDGYWILSDLTSTPNLHQRSKAEIKRIFSKNDVSSKEFNGKQVLILIYGSINFLLFAYFILYQLLFNWQEILEFPQFLYQNLKHLVQFDFSNLSFEANQMKYFIFYFMAFSYLIRFLKYLQTKFILKKEA